MFRVLALLGLLLPMAVWAADNESEAPVQDLSVQDSTQKPVQKRSESTTSTEKKPAESQKLQANIVLHTLAELEQLLVQAEEISNNDEQYNLTQPIAIVLHGEEIKAFIRTNYRTNKQMVDLAARLDAFKVIDIKVCKRWIGQNNIMLNELPAFLEPVPFGAAEKTRLQRSGYAYF
jgi:intracellular sulfur oxidation DsrE/DsrF family protein